MQMWGTLLIFSAEPLQSCCGEAICANDTIHTFLCGVEVGIRKVQDVD